MPKGKRAKASTKPLQPVAGLRQQIDRVDDQMVRLLNRRATLALKVRKAKAARGRARYAPDRERAIYQRIEKLNAGPMTTEGLRSCYREILSACLALARPLRVAYLGPSLTFTHLAARQQFGSQLDYVPCTSITEVFAEVDHGRADYGVVPIENSIEGAVNHTLDMFMDSQLIICSEIQLPITHCLVAKASVPYQQIRQVSSNPLVFAQCRNWLEEHLPNARQVEVLSTAHAAQQVAKQGAKTWAAIASAEAAAEHGLRILERSIQDQADNMTRFLVIGTEPSAPTGQDKTSVMFAVRDRVGALQAMLMPFKRHKINLTKIESRPTKQRAWKYCFFIDLQGHIQDARVSKALEELKEECTVLKVLGSYPVAT